MTPADLTAWNARNRLARAEYRLNPVTSFGVSGPCRVCGATNDLSQRRVPTVP